MYTSTGQLSFLHVHVNYVNYDKSLSLLPVCFTQAVQQDMTESQIHNMKRGARRQRKQQVGADVSAMTKAHAQGSQLGITAKQQLAMAT